MDGGGGGGRGHVAEVVAVDPRLLHRVVHDGHLNKKFTSMDTTDCSFILVKQIGLISCAVFVFIRNPFSLLERNS